MAWRRGRGLSVVALVSALVVAAVGCGSSSKAGGSGGSASGSPSGSASAAGGGVVRGVTDSQITVGGLSEVSLYPGIEDGARARYEALNRAGGVNGRKIKFVGVRDDGSDSGRDLDLSRSLVGNDKVFAVSPIASAVFLPASSDYLGSESVPFVGWGFQPGFCGPQWGFGFNGCLIGTKFINSSLVSAAVQASGLKPADAKIAIESGDSSFGKSANDQAKTGAKAIGADLVYSQADYPPDKTASDNTPYVQAILAAKPNIVLINLAFASTVGVVGALKAAGFKGKIYNFIAYVPGLLDSQPDVAAALDGTYTETQIVPREGGSAAVKQIESDLKAIGKTPFAGLGQQLGWFSADLLIQMIAKAGRNLTPATFNAAVNGKGFTYKSLPGGLGPVSFPDGHTAPTPCSAIVEVVGKTYKQILPLTCYKSIPAA